MSLHDKTRQRLHAADFGQPAKTSLHDKTRQRLHAADFGQPAKTSLFDMVIALVLGFVKASSIGFALLLVYALVEVLSK